MDMVLATKNISNRRATNADYLFFHFEAEYAEAVTPSNSYALSGTNPYFFAVLLKIEFTSHLPCYVAAVSFVGNTVAEKIPSEFWNFRQSFSVLAYAIQPHRVGTLIFR